MNFIGRVLESIMDSYGNPAITTVTLLSMLSIVFLLAVYEYIIYRVVSHRAFYSRAFNITIAVLPFFISTIILCLQSNLVITLGTIGALAIIRFRTAVKDPVDMVYILWSVHIGIICGCQLYEVAVLTSLLVTLFLIFFSNIKIGGKSYCLVIHVKSSDDEETLLSLLKKYSKNNRIKSRNYTEKGMDYVIECSLKNPAELTKALEKEDVVVRFSLLEYDVEDIV